MVTIQVNNTSFFENTLLFTPKLEQSEKAQENPLSFFAGNTNLTNDPIAQKRKEAQEKAMKVVSDAWNVDKEIDKSVEKRQKHYEEMLSQKGEAQAELNAIHKAREEAAKLYDEDDPIRKAIEEDLDKRAEEFLSRVQDAEKYMRDDLFDIKAIALERLKSAPVADAQKNKDAILEAASDEIMGMLMEEAKEFVDQKQEETEEKAEEIAKKEEAKEEKLEAIKELRAMQEAVIEGTKEALEKTEATLRKNQSPEIPLDQLIELVKSNSEMDKAQQTVDKLKYSMNLLEADLKGIEIDSEV